MINMPFSLLQCLGDKYSITTDLDGIFSLSINPTMICDQGEYRAEIEGFVASTCGLRVIGELFRSGVSTIQLL